MVVMNNKRWLQRAVGGSLCDPRGETCLTPMITLHFDFRCDSAKDTTVSTSVS